MLKVVYDEAESNATSGSVGSSSLLDEIVRDGARQMLAAALQAEVAAYVEQFTESTFATVRLRQRVTKGPGSRPAGGLRALASPHRLGTAA